MLLTTRLLPRWLLLWSGEKSSFADLFWGVIKPLHFPCPYLTPTPVYGGREEEIPVKVCLRQQCDIQGSSGET